MLHTSRFDFSHLSEIQDPSGDTLLKKREIYFQIRVIYSEKVTPCKLLSGHTPDAIFEIQRGKKY